MGTYYPRIDTFARASTNTSYYDVNRRLNGWTLGVMGSWELFDGGERFGARRSGLASIRASVVKEDAKKYEIVSQLKELSSRINSLENSVNTQTNAVSLKTQEVGETLRFFENGLVPFKDVLEAQNGLLHAQINLLEVINRTNSLIYQFDYWVGSIPMGVNSKDVKETICKYEL